MFNAIEQGWSTTDHLLAGVVDLLAVLAWQNSADAVSSFPRHRPKPIPRPGENKKTRSNAAPLMGGMSASVMTIEEFQKRIQERRAAH